MKRFKEFFRKHNSTILIIIVLILGFGAGLIGEIVSRAYLADSLLGFSPFGSLDFSSGKYADRGLVISNAKNVIVQEDAKIDETINSVSTSLVGIYKKQNTARSSKVFILDNFYKIWESSGQGFIITSDGWIVTRMDLLKTYGDYVVISKDKKIYRIDKAVADNLTGFNFIHIEAKDLPIRKFAENRSIRSGQSAIVMNWSGISLVSSVAGFSRSDGLVKSSDNFSEKLLINEKLTAEFIGSAIFNLAGEAIGLVNGKGEIEPIGHLSGAIKSLFNNQTVARPGLGINYLDLSEFAEIDGRNNNWQKGTIVYKAETAVKKNSPAEKAGLRDGDIIVSVDDIYLNKDNDLPSIIQDHLIGEVVNLTIIRDGEEKVIKVTLEEL